MKRAPAAPPVYRPLTPKVLQPKAAIEQQPPAARPARTPVAPPVYSPQAKPKCLQPKAAKPSASGTAQAKPAAMPAASRRPAPSKNVAQPKGALKGPPPRGLASALPQVLRGGARSSQPPRPGLSVNAPRAGHPPVVQRAVNVAAIMKTAQGAEAYTAFKHAMAQMPQQTMCKALWDAASASLQAPRLDIVFSDGGESGATLGHAQLFNDYNSNQQATVKDTLIANVKELQNDTLTILINAAASGTFLGLSAGQIASTLAHEFAIHATKLGEVVDIIRNQSSLGPGRAVLINREDELFDGREQHRAIFTINHPLHQEFTLLIQNMANYFRGKGDKANEAALMKAHETDINEHTTDEKWEQLKEDPSFSKFGSFLSSLIKL